MPPRPIRASMRYPATTRPRNGSADVSAIIRQYGSPGARGYARARGRRGGSGGGAGGERQAADALGAELRAAGSPSVDLAPGLEQVATQAALAAPDVVLVLGP